MARPGKVFEYEISSALRVLKDSKKAFFYRRLLDSARLGIRVPADFLAIHAGKARLFECKSTKNKVSFPFRNVAEHQISDLLEAEEAGAESWLLIKHSCHAPVVYAIPIRFWKAITNDYKRKSIKWTELDAICEWIISKDTNKNWDLNPLF